MEYQIQRSVFRLERKIDLSPTIDQTQKVRSNNKPVTTNIRRSLGSEEARGEALPFRAGSEDCRGRRVATVTGLLSKWHLCASLPWVRKIFFLHHFFRGKRLGALVLHHGFVSFSLLLNVSFGCLRMYFIRQKIYSEAFFGFQCHCLIN